MNLKNLSRYASLLVALFLCSLGAKAADYALSVAPFSIAPGETKDVVINISAANSDLKTIVFYLTLPEGFEFVENDGETFDFLSQVDADAAITNVASNPEKKDENNQTIIIYNELGVFVGTQYLYPFVVQGEGPFGKVKVKASDNAFGTATSVQMVVSGIQFVNKDRVTTSQENFEVTVSKDQSSSVEPYYTLSSAPAQLTLAEGVEKSVALSLESNVACGGLQFQLRAPGMEIVSIEKGDNVTPTATFIAQNMGDFYNVMITNTGSNLALANLSGVFANVKVRGGSDLAATSAISLSQIEFEGMDGTTPSLPDFQVPVVREQSSIVFSVSPQEIKIGNGQQRTIDINLDNSVTCGGIQFQVRAPGLKIVSANKADRFLSGTQLVQRDNGDYYNVMVIGGTKGALSGNTGTFLTLTVEGTADEASAISFSQIEFEGMDGSTATLADTQVTVVDLTAPYEDAIAAIDDLQENLNNVVNGENSLFVDATEAQAIQTEINNLKAQVEKAYADGNEAGLNVDTADLQARIEALATAAQNAKNRNDELKASFDEQIGMLQDALNGTVAEIAKECPLVAEQYDGAEIQAMIDELKAKVDGYYAAGTMDENEDEILEEGTAINDAISALLPDAKNAEYMANITIQIDELQKALDGTVAEIAKECPLVAEQYNGAEIQAMIDELKDNVEAYNDEKSLIEHEAEIRDAGLAIYDAIEALLPDAKNAEYMANITIQINDLQEALDGTVAEIKRECPLVADQYTGTEIQAMIDELKDNVEAYNDEKSLIEHEAEIRDAGLAIYDAIEALLPDAKNAEYMANITIQINDLQEALDGTVAEIAKECPLVADQYTGAEIQDMIDDLKAKVEAYNDEKSLIDHEAEIRDAGLAIYDAIEALLPDAKNADLKANFDEQIEMLQNALNDTVDEIAEKYPSVADQFNGEDIQDMIDALVEKVEGYYDDKTMVDHAAEIVAEGQAINEAISQLLPDAEKAVELAADKRNEELKASFDEQIGMLQNALDATVAQIAKEYPSVADQFNGKDIQAMIDTLKAKVEDYYLNHEMEARAEEIVAEGIDINNAISELLPAAKAAAEAENDELKASFDEQIGMLQNALDATVAQIAKEYPSVADRFNGEDIQDMIDALVEKVDGYYANMQMAAHADEIVEEGIAINNAISELLPAAKAAAEGEDQQPLKDQIDAIVNDLQAKLDAARETIENHYANVADEFTGDEIQDQINDMALAAARAFENGTLAQKYDEIVAPKDEIESDITALVNDAAKESARRTYNLNAYETDLDILNNVADDLWNEKKWLEQHYPGSADQAEYNAIVDAIDAQRILAINEYNRVKAAGYYVSPIDETVLRDMIDDYVNNVMTGLKYLYDDETIEDVMFFDMNGHRLAAPAQGEINIIVHKNGKTEKYIMR